MKVLIVGQNPSKNNVDLDTAFVGSRSYDTLTGWIDKVGLKIEECILVNASKKTGKVTLRDADFYNLIIASYYCDKIICLGNYAERCMTKINKLSNNKEILYFKLPHPSGLNRVLNDKKHINKILEECKEYLHEKT